MDFPLLVFTDLDGTLLDHDSYSFKGAHEALQHLHVHSIPIILTTSKTRAEVHKLQKQLGLSEPFIVENGGGLFMPCDTELLPADTLEVFDDCCGRQFGRPYSYIRRIFKKIQSKYNIKGFGDMSVDEIMAATGLDREDARLAAQRDFTEPFLFLAEPRFLEINEAVAEYNLNITRGGRFYHLMAAEQDKGRAVAQTINLFKMGHRKKFITVGLGDAENDYPMLKTVEIPVLIPKPDGNYENFDLPGLRRAPHPGSRGWGAAVTDILNEYSHALSHHETPKQD